jgi:regulator of replication initiation timing
MEGSHGGYTMIRIGLALMKIHQDRLLEMTEMEDVLKLLLSKDLWNGITGDSLVDIAGGELKELITLSELQKLDEEYTLKTKVNEKKPGSDVQAVANRFLRKLKWTTVESISVPPPMIRTLSKASFTSSSQDTSEPPQFLRTQTEGALMSRSPSTASFRVTSDTERALHAQIEDLMKMLADVQRKLGESETEKDNLKSENAKLRDTLTRVVSAVGGTEVEKLNISCGSDKASTLSDEVSEILSSSSTSLQSSASSYSESSLDDDIRGKLTEANHLVQQERQANILLQQQLSTTENELSRTRAALMELRSKYTEVKRERQPSNDSTKSGNSPLRELKLTLKTNSDSGLSPSTPPTSGSSTSAGSSWSGWFGRH